MCDNSEHHIFFFFFWFKIRIRWFGRLERSGPSVEINNESTPIVILSCSALFLSAQEKGYFRHSVYKTKKKNSIMYIVFRLLCERRKLNVRALIKKNEKKKTKMKTETEKVMEDLIWYSSCYFSTQSRCIASYNSQTKIHTRRRQSTDTQK